MRESVKQFVEVVAKTLPIYEPIFKFGALQVPRQEGFADHSCRRSFWRCTAG